MPKSIVERLAAVIYEYSERHKIIVASHENARKAMKEEHANELASLNDGKRDLETKLKEMQDKHEANLQDREKKWGNERAELMSKHTSGVRTTETRAKTLLVQSLPHQIQPTTAAEEEYQIQHADYVNQSRIQAMLAGREQPLSRSTPMASALPTIFTSDEKPSASSHPQPHYKGGNVTREVGLGYHYGGGGGTGRGPARRGSDPYRNQGDSSEAQRQHELQHQTHHQSGPTSLPSPLLHRQEPAVGRSHLPAGHPQKPPTAAPRKKELLMRAEQHRLGDDVLTPGINTEVHNVAQGVLDDMVEGGEGAEVTGIPYDPNLTCILCQKVFRIGEIQLYHSHTAKCGGTVV